MDKWADYLISEVSYDPDHLVSVAIRHQDTDKGITKGMPVDRMTMTSDIKNGLFYVSIYRGRHSWKKGYSIQTFSIDGNPYLRIDGNKVKLDYLGDLPEALILKSKFVKKLESPPEPIPEPSEEEATPEQLARLEQLEKQIHELESPPEPIPEPSEEEATPEQLARLEQLEKQIHELENALATELYTSSDESPIDQFSIVKESGKDIEAFEPTDVEHEIIQTLREQNKKLDDIEKKLHDSTPKKDI
ncbi:MAG: hypothetical protein OES34_07165 [Nitrosopumilus sp.]|nr:hypothetical protein [Nitrosopumilus sp.]